MRNLRTISMAMAAAAICAIAADGADAASTASGSTDTTAAPAPKYPALSKNFERGSFAGQLSSVHRDREASPDKAAQFKQAIADGADFITIPAEITSGQAAKMGDLGIPVPASTTVKQRTQAAPATGTEG
ncbi:exported hypothetical protein [Gammaproteobacteria bacterium]